MSDLVPSSPVPPPGVATDPAVAMQSPVPVDVPVRSHAAEAVLRLTVDLVASGVTPPNLDVLCRTAAGALGVDGVAITLASFTGNRAVIGGSDETARTIEAIQLTVGEGPCTESTATNSNVQARDVLDPADVRWPMFVHHLGDLPVRALAATPLLVGTGPVGSLDMYSSRPGGLDSLDPGTVADLGRAVVVAVLALRADDTSDVPVSFDVDSAVHQATGMVASALGVSVADALARLRGIAFVDGRLVEDVSRDVVEGRMGPSLD